MRYVLKIAYDGTNYAGWQCQKNAPTVQEELEKAIEETTTEEEQKVVEDAVEEFEKEMEGIYSTSVKCSTLDESPMAYKPMDEIVSLISPTVDIVKVIKPVYNFKAGK